MRTVIPFTIEHGMALDVTLPLNRLYEYTLGPSFTLIVDDKVICAAGVTIMWEGVGLAWAMMGPDTHNHKIFITRTVRRVLRDIQRALSLDRIEALSYPDDARWLSILGLFQEEDSIARKYINKKDVMRFELVRGDYDID